MGFQVALLAADSTKYFLVSGDRANQPRFYVTMLNFRCAENVVQPAVGLDDLGLADFTITGGGVRTLIHFKEGETVPESRTCICQFLSGASPSLCAAARFEKWRSNE